MVCRAISCCLLQQGWPEPQVCGAGVQEGAAWYAAMSAAVRPVLGCKLPLSPPTGECPVCQQVTESLKQGRQAVL